MFVIVEKLLLTDQLLQLENQNTGREETYELLTASVRTGKVHAASPTWSLLLPTPLNAGEEQEVRAEAQDSEEESAEVSAETVGSPEESAEVTAEEELGSQELSSPGCC